MASRRGVQGVDIGDVDELLKRAKKIRKKYKALKKSCDSSRAGKGVAAAEIRKLADALKKAISEAQPGSARSGRSMIPSPALPSAGMAVAHAMPRAESVSRLPVAELGRKLLGFLRSVRAPR